MKPQLSSQLEAAALRAGIDPATMQMTASMASAPPAASKPMAQPPMMYQAPVGAPQAPVASAAPVESASLAQSAPPAAPVAAPVPDPVQVAVMAERKRIADISSMALPAQAQLATQLINNGMSVGDAAVALLKDRDQTQQNPATQDASQTTAQATAQLAAQLRNTPPIPVTTEEKPSMMSQYNALTDPHERQAFLSAHQQELMNERNRKARS